MKEWVRGIKIERYKPGVIYAFEFFSTTCDHCEEAAPQLAEMARAFGSRGVVFIGVSSEPAEKLKAWLTEPIQQERITYDIVSDPTKAAEHALQDGTLMINTPNLCIIRDGVVQWYGHPRLAQDVLTALLEDKWDPATVRAQFMHEARLASARAKIGESARTCEKSGDYTPLFTLLDAIVLQMPEERTRFDLERFGRMLGIAGQAQAAYVLGREIALRNPTDGATFRNLARITVTEPNSTLRDLDFALEMAQAAELLAGGKDPKTAVGLARVQFALGNREAAIQEQERAISLESDQATLNKYRSDLERYKTQPPGPVPVKTPAPRKPASA